MIAILAVGVALAGLVLNGQRGVNVRLDGIDKRIDGIDKRMDSIDKRMDSIDERLRAVETALAEVKGQLTIVRDYISGRNARGQGPTEAGAGD
ncbi:MAG: hypothetical protein OXN81_14040 [Alphaproteobacteria bacterium]|nr:hypothetical protein [Alphaproteobacteria bacterium]